MSDRAFIDACMLLSQRRWSEAIAAFDAVLAATPHNFRAHNNRGVALHNLHRDTEALASYGEALRIASEYPAAWCNRGNALTSLRRYDLALSAYDEALHFDPKLAAAYDNRGALNLTLARYSNAARDFEALVALAPEHPYARANLLFARAHDCDWRDYEALRQRVNEGVRAGKPTSPPFAALAFLDNPADQLKCARDWAQHFFPAARVIAPTPVPSKRIRLAYLSADFHEHATAHLMADLFALHDRSRFEVLAFSYGPVKRDAMRARLEAAFDVFLDVSTMSDTEIADAIAARHVDIAIDLKGYTLDGRPGILAHRCAPVQASFVGFPGTLGAPYVDCVIADAIVAPSEHDAFYSERIVRLPHCYQPNSARVATPPPSRRDVGLPDDVVVFCCFNNAFKITPDTFARWMRILRGADHSVLWLYASDTAAQNLRREAQAAGVDPTRLVFAPHVRHAAHLARLSLADVFLDTAPYNAHTTASDALWAGVPVITVLGATFASRVAASIVTAAGVPELVTESPAYYEKLALDLAHSPAALTALKAKLKAARASAPLFDIARYARDLEHAYEEMLGR